MAHRSVGRVSRTRVSSAITPSFKGTLKSTRIKTRLPRKSTSLIVSLFMASSSQRSVLGTDSVRKRHPQQRAKRAQNLDAMNLIRSRQRQEYPHSLSYQASTFTQRSPTTLVYPASTMEELGLPLKSADTNSSSVYARIPFIGPLAAAFSAPLTLSTVAVLSTNTVKSTTLTFGVGTRMAYPSSLPFNAGITRCKAFAAPVELGIMLIAAALARRKSLCGKSSNRWSLVYE